MFAQLKYLLLTVLLSCLTPALHAEDEWMPELSDIVDVRGFGTIGMARLNTDRYGVISSFSQRQPVKSEWSPYLDSVFGVQADVKAGDKNTFVFQGIWHPAESDSPFFKLAYWELRPFSVAKLRLGRIPNPMFRETEYFHVGYAQLPARPALPVYSKLAAINHLDGGDIRLQLENGDWVYGLQFFGGDARYTHYRYGVLNQPLQADISNMRGIAAQAMSGKFTFRVSHTRVGGIDYDADEIRAVNAGVEKALAGLRLAGRVAQAELLEQYRNPFSAKNVSYTSVSADWQPGSWQLLGEYTLLNTNSLVVGASKAWQITIGRSFELLTPYFVYSKQITAVPELVEGAFAGPMLNGLRANIDSVVRRSDLSMRTIGIGMRWEVSNNMAFKAQLDRLRWNVPYVGSENVAAGEVPKATLFSVVLDFVF